MRLIDADAFKEYIKDGIVGLILPKDQAVKMIAITKSFLKDIDEQPTVEARPHGEWIEKHCDYGVYYRCSNCHKMPPNYECDYKEGAIKTNFCPNCGVSMRKEGEAE